MLIRRRFDMADILHKLSIAAPRDRVYQALATREGLAGWWTTTTDGQSAPGETLSFRFNKHVTEMKVEDLKPSARVVWRCTRATPEWEGTQVTFDLTEEGGRTTLLFGQRGWAEAGDFYATCSTKWATFLLSLREFAETGKGRPFPHDLSI
jgi:uncharacterized protein YndB with AHSA1/START domain